MSLSAGKLYVTEPDERSGPKRRYFCGLFGCVLLLAVLVVAVLIGGGFCCCFFSHLRNFQYCFPVGVIRPRKLPDDSGGFPEGAVINVFDGEVRW